ncbi:hypothetical protein IQ06DRAFT_18923 [Phaeosphaeriaceae sp. SRC1lsM3a]|nr:hypothetical protein IQ06DRAFT_18923 [Stagonospora sp. SRC1lsM3a]
MHRYIQSEQDRNGMRQTRLHQPIGRVRHGLHGRMRYGIELGVFEFIFRADLDERALVVCAVAVVWCREDGDTAAVVLDLVAVHADLVGSDDGIETIVFAKSLGDVRSELQSNTTLAGPSPRSCLRVGPKHLHHETRLARLSLLEAVELPNVIQRNFVVGEETAMKNKVLLADECSQW